jgi:hypothetical protein
MIMTTAATAYNAVLSDACDEAAETELWDTVVVGTVETTEDVIVGMVVLGRVVVVTVFPGPLFDGGIVVVDCGTAVLLVYVPVKPVWLPVLFVDEFSTLPLAAPAIGAEIETAKIDRKAAKRNKLMYLLTLEFFPILFAFVVASLG